MKTQFTVSLCKVPLMILCLIVFKVSLSQDLKITPTSNLLVDAASYSNEKNVDLTDGVVVRDFRLGIKGTYNKFYFRADASLALNKVSMKDVYVQYNINKKSYVRGGHYTVPFGLQSAYGTSQKEFMEEPSTNVYQVGRRVGLMHTLWSEKLWFSYGAFADNKSITEGTETSGKQGYMLSERFVYRPIATEKSLLQAGFSFGHTSAEAVAKGKAHAVSYKVNYLTVVDKTPAANVTVDSARYENKYTIELVGFYKNFILETQYYNSDVARLNNKPSFHSGGFYAVARALVFGKKQYTYSKSMAGPNTPADALEVGFGYTLLDLNDSKAKLYGGRMEDISFGLTYYWNKYVTVRTNYSFINVKTKDTDPVKKTNALQLRLQFYL